MNGPANPAWTPPPAVELWGATREECERCQKRDAQFVFRHLRTLKHLERKVMTEIEAPQSQHDYLIRMRVLRRFRKAIDSLLWDVWAWGLKPPGARRHKTGEA